MSFPFPAFFYRFPFFPETDGKFLSVFNPSWVSPDTCCLRFAAPEEWSVETFEISGIRHAPRGVPQITD
jgi:hypothetical protein